MDTPTPSHAVFVTGGTGYIGRRLVPSLIERGHGVTGLVRETSRNKCFPLCNGVPGDALRRSSYVHAIQPCDTFVHLVGVAHPSPSKAKLFKEVDLVAAREAVAAACEAGTSHFIYVSVAHPAPTMKAYIEVRVECEALIRSSGLHATILRPWYVLGPGHRWPFVLVPMYWLAAHVPSTRESSLRLGLVSIGQMVRSLVWAVEHPANGIQVLEVPDIRQH